MSKFIFQISILSILMINYSCKNSSVATKDLNSEVAIDTTTMSPENNKQCFFYALNRDTTTVSIEIKGDSITGEMIWNPYEKDGAVGTLSGIKTANGEFDLMYNYMIEGSQQTETKIMKIENDQLLIKVGELVDPNNDGNLKYKDVTKATFSEVLNKVSCK